MFIVIAAILLTVVLIAAPIAALKVAIGAGGLTDFLALIGILLCLPLGYGWYTVFASDGYGDGWYEVWVLMLGFAAALLGTLVSLWALSSARSKEKKFQEALKNMETGRPAPERTEPPVTHKVQ